MTLTPDQAQQKQCLAPQNRPGPRQPCCGADCVAYWRWADVNKSLGYCALGGKPEF